MRCPQVGGGASVVRGIPNVAQVRQTVVNAALYIDESLRFSRLRRAVGLRYVNKYTEYSSEVLEILLILWSLNEECRFTWA